MIATDQTLLPGDMVVHRQWRAIGHDLPMKVVQVNAGGGQWTECSWYEDTRFFRAAFPTEDLIKLEERNL